MFLLLLPFTDSGLGDKVSFCQQIIIIIIIIIIIMIIITSFKSQWI